MSQEKKRQEPAIKRRYTRYHIDIRLMATVVREGVTITVHGRCDRLAEGGLSAVMAGELVPGETAALEFWLPVGPDPLQLRAVVRYRRGFHHGFQFLDPTPAQRQAIRRHCQGLVPAR